MGLIVKKQMRESSTRKVLKKKNFRSNNDGTKNEGFPELLRGRVHY